MLISWNIKVLNKVVKIREDRSHLSIIKPAITVLVETRVKAHKASTIREKLHFQGEWLDNYLDHPNGRIWVH